MQPELVDQARDLIAPLLAAGAVTAGGRARHRVLVGIAGPPGAGKSTLAAALVREFAGSVAVGLDGFHLSNDELARLALGDRKGAPETFDAAGFVELMRRIRAADDLVYAPAYSRVLHESIGGAIPVHPDTPLVVVEGNYLLLPHEPWVRARSLFDLVLYLDAPAAERVDGLVRRQRSRGLDPQAARAWVLRSDEANARVVEASRQYADVALHRLDA